jgi:hypothetical protein
MKISSLCLGILITGGWFATLSSIASAGEGGSAGSISVIMSNGEIAQLSAASAVGKLNASAVTNATTTDTFAHAYGSGGAIKITGAGTTSVVTISAIETDTSMATSQANNLAISAATINAKLGAVVIP